MILIQLTNEIKQLKIDVDHTESSTMTNLLRQLQHNGIQTQAIYR